MKRIKDVLDDSFWLMPATPQFIEDGEVPYITSKNIKVGKIDFSNVQYISNTAFEEISKNRPIKKNDLIVSMIGTLGNIAVVKESDGRFYGQNMYLLRLNSNIVDLDYFYHFFNSDIVKRHIESKKNKSTQSYLKANHIEEIQIPIPSLDIQKKVASIFNKTEELISCRKEQLAKLDELVKARFVEMFGDPEHNERAIHTLPMTELCEIIDGDRGTNYPKQEEFSDNGFCLFLNAKNVTANGFSFENCMFITAEKDKLLRKGKLSRGDVVLTTRGTLGNLAFYNDTVKYEHVRINSGMVILRLKRDRIIERFFIEQFKMQLSSIKEKIASGSAQPQLPISTMNKIMLLVPDIEEQKQFSAFVEQTDKTKAEVQKSLDELETLKKSLMQKYFG